MAKHTLKILQYTTRFLNYVWPFFEFFHEGANMVLQIFFFMSLCNALKKYYESLLYSFMTEVTIIEKPIHLFALQINGLVSV